MKTTVQISDALLNQAKALAEIEGITLRELVEDGLRRVLDEHKSLKPYEPRDESYGSGGMLPEVTQQGWEKIRELIYEDHGA